MINVTDAAAAVLLERLQSSSSEESEVLRLVERAGGLGLSVDHEREGDQVVDHENRKVLVIEPDISSALDGATIDAAETPEGEQLTFRRGPE